MREIRLLIVTLVIFIILLIVQSCQPDTDAGEVAPVATEACGEWEVRIYSGGTKVEEYLTNDVNMRGGYAYFTSCEGHRFKTSSGVEFVAERLRDD